MDGPVENTGALITRSVNSRAGLTQVSSVEHKSQDTTQCRNSWESGNKGSFSVFPGLAPAKNAVSNSSQTGATGNPHLDGGSSSPKWISCLIWSHFPGKPKEGCRWELRLITSAGYDLCSSESPAPLCKHWSRAPHRHHQEAEATLPRTPCLHTSAFLDFVDVSGFAAESEGLDLTRASRAPPVCFPLLFRASPPSV